MAGETLCLLALCLGEGAGIEQNLKEDLELLMHSAELGTPFARAILAAYYFEEGLFPETEYKRIYEWAEIVSSKFPLYI